MKNALLAALDDVLRQRQWGEVHYAMAGTAPVDAWVPAYAHVEVVRSGRLPITYESNGGTQSPTLSKRDIFYGVPHAWNWRGYDTSRSLFCIHFMPEYVRFTLSSRSPRDKLGMEPQQWYHTSEPLGPTGCMVVLALNMAICENRDCLVTRQLLCALLGLARDQLAGDAGRRMGKRHDTWLRLRDHVAERFQLPINRNTVADDFGFDPDYVSRLFTVEGGESFNAFLTRLRLERAAALLSSSAAALAHVAAQSGFMDAGYFIKVFCRRYGVTPGKWRMRSRAGKTHA